MQRIKKAYAENGDLKIIPDIPPLDGSENWEQGRGYYYELDNTPNTGDPLALNISRKQDNYFKNVISKNIKHWQENSYPIWFNDIEYPKNAIVKYEDVLYASKVDNNTALPTDTINWKIYDPSSLDLPKGFIGMWSGSIASIPSGWALCNGANGTPDLRDRFVIGSSIDVSGVSNTAVTGANTKSGGSKDAIVVSHTHTGTTNTTGDHTHDANQITDGTLFMGTTISNKTYANRATSSSGAHSHSLSINSTGSSATNANLPPYYALAFIMKL